MIVEIIGESSFKPLSGDVNLSCVRHFNSFSSNLAIIISCLRHYHLNYFSTHDSHDFLMINDFLMTINDLNDYNCL